ncbi:MAG: nicotinate-nucleotide adenylyltransferase [Planctomycetota bacterium]
MRLGIFGGSFDPVHNGHVTLARHAREQAELDELWFVPTAVQPHKRSGPVASDADRLAMLRLAIDVYDGLEVSTVELERGGVSYTVDTLRDLCRQRPEADLFLIMGADTLRDLPAWHDPVGVLEVVTPLVVARDGETPDYGVLSLLASPERIAEIEARAITMPPQPVSSSEVRRRIAAGEAIDELVPASVRQYVERSRLYQSPPDSR